MAEGNAEFARRGLDAFNSHDADAMLALSAPDVVLVPMRALLEGGDYEGHDGLRRYLQDMDEDWAEYRIEADEIRELDDGALLLGRFHAVGRASGVELNQPVAWHSQYRDGLLVRLRAYSDTSKALESVGLSA